jgi:hypothetical protein
VRDEGIFFLPTYGFRRRWRMEITVSIFDRDHFFAGKATHVLQSVVRHFGVLEPLLWSGAAVVVRRVVDGKMSRRTDLCGFRSSALLASPR